MFGNNIGKLMVAALAAMAGLAQDAEIMRSRNRFVRGSARGFGNSDAGDVKENRSPDAAVAKKTEAQAKRIKKQANRLHLTGRARREFLEANGVEPDARCSVIL